MMKGEQIDSDDATPHQGRGVCDSDPIRDLEAAESDPSEKIRGKDIPDSRMPTVE